MRVILSLVLLRVLRFRIFAVGHNSRDGTAEHPQSRVIAVVDPNRDIARIFAGVDHDAIDAADCDNAIVLFEVVQHGLHLGLPFSLGSSNQEVEQRANRNHWQQQVSQTSQRLPFLGQEEDRASSIRYEPHRIHVRKTTVRSGGCRRTARRVKKAQRHTVELVLTITSESS